MIDKALAQNGCSVVQIVGRDFQVSRNWDLTGIEIIRVPELAKYIYPLNDIIAFYKLYQLLNKIKPHIVHTHLAKAGAVGRIAAKLSKVPVVIHTVHGPTFSGGMNLIKRVFFKILEAFCAKFTDYFIFVGEELREQYVNSKICLPEKTIVIKTGRSRKEISLINDIGQTDIENTRKAILGDNEAFLIGYVGRLVPSKAQDIAIQILEILRAKNVPAYLVLIGEGHLKEELRYKNYLKKLVSKRRLDGRVVFLGYQDNIFTYIKSVDALVLTSKYEGLPNIAVESALAQKPLVAFRVCGISEVVNNGETGFIVERGDNKAMAEKLEYIWRNPQFAKDMGKSAYDKICNIYNAERMVEEELNFYSSLLSNINKN